MPFEVTPGMPSGCLTPIPCRFDEPHENTWHHCTETVMNQPIRDGGGQTARRWTGHPGFRMSDPADRGS